MSNFFKSIFGRKSCRRVGAGLVPFLRSGPLANFRRGALEAGRDGSAPVRELWSWRIPVSRGDVWFLLLISAVVMMFPAGVTLLIYGVFQ